MSYPGRSLTARQIPYPVVLNHGARLPIDPRTRRNPWLRLAIFSLAGGLFLLGYWWGNQYKTPGTTPLRSAVLLRPALHLPDFQARDHRGGELNLAALRGRWTLLLAGPLDGAGTQQALAQMTRIHNRLAEQPERQRDLRMLLLSPLPARDTPGRLRDAIRAYNPAMHAAAGEPAALAGLFGALGITDAASGTPSLYLLDAEARALAVFTASDDPATIAADLRAIQETTPQP